MVANDNAGLLNARVALRFIASKLAPTGVLYGFHDLNGRQNPIPSYSCAQLPYL